MVQKQYQTSWHDVKFNSISDPSPDQLADRIFYDNFYCKFFQRYSSFSDLDSSYIEARLDVFNFIVSKLSPGSNVLSIGCGIGLFEYMIKRSELYSNLNLIALEPSIIATKWLNNTDVTVINGYFPDAVQSLPFQIDFAYARALEYVFDQVQYVIFLKSIKDFGIKNFTLISVSIERTSLIDRLKYYIKNCLHYLRIRERGKFWGYVRKSCDHLDAFREAGFQQVHFEQINDFTVAVTGIAQ